MEPLGQQEVERVVEAQVEALEVVLLVQGPVAALGLASCSKGHGLVADVAVEGEEDWLLQPLEASGMGHWLLPL